jgi:hypothetical protein
MIAHPKEPAMRLSDLLAAAAVSLVLVGCGQDRSNASGPGATATPVATAAGGSAATPAPAAAPAAGAPIPGGAGSDLPRSINTRDPVDGLPVDPSIPPVVVEIGVVSPPLTVVIGISNADNAKRIKSDPEKYAGAARNNNVARQETDTLLPK